MARATINPENELRESFRKAYRKFNSQLAKLRSSASAAEHEQLDRLRLEFAAIEWELRRTELDAAASGFEALSTEAVALGNRVAADVATWKSIRAASEAISAFFGLLSRVMVGFRV